MPMGFQPLSAVEEEKRLALYRQGLMDKEIAAVLGVSASTVKSWRHNRGLPGHRRRPGLSRGGGRRPRAKAGTVDPVLRAAATCDAMAHPRRLADRPKVISVSIETGRLTVHRADSWWPVWRGRRAS